MICILFLMPITPTGIPWKTGFDWNVVNYAPITVGGALLLFGGWYVLSAHKWFKGPVRQGTEEELEPDRVRLRRVRRVRATGRRLGHRLRRAARSRPPPPT